MATAYRVFLARTVHESLNRLSGAKKRSIEKYIDYLSDNPFDEGDFSELDSEGRRVYCKIIRDHAITYYPDHAVKEIKVIELVTTP